MPKKRHRAEERFKERFWLQKQRKGFMAEVLAESEGNTGWVVRAGGDQLQLLSLTLTFLLKFLQRKRPIRLLEAWFPEGVKILQNADPRV